MHTHRTFLLVAGSALVLMAHSALPASAQKIDPDPDIFDGTVVGRGGGGGIQIDPSIDLGNWEESSVVVYGPEGQNPQPFSVGVQGIQLPGMQGQMPGGMQQGSGIQIPGLGIPLPMGGGGNSDQSNSGQQSMSSAQSGEPGQQGGQQPPPGMQGSTGDAQGAGGPPPPANVAIGDPENAIRSEVPPPVDGTPMENPAGNEGSDGRASKDRTQVKAASGQQTGRRGGDVETGDAMPTDL